LGAGEEEEGKKKNKSVKPDGAVNGKSHNPERGKGARHYGGEGIRKKPAREPSLMRSGALDHISKKKGKGAGRKKKVYSSI